jgi:signal transduction histidine kinase
MRLGIKAKQVLGVTTIVGVVVVALTGMHVIRLSELSINEIHSRADVIAKAIFQRAHAVVAEGADPYVALRNDPGLRSILESSLYFENVGFAAIVDTHGLIVAHSDPQEEGRPLAPAADLRELISHSSLYQIRAVYSGQGRNLELSQPLLLNDTEFGSIRIGVSTLLVRSELNRLVWPTLYVALIAFTVSIFGAMGLAQVLLRPIHIIRSGLTRLGRGEFGIRLDLNQRDEFGELGEFFNTVSAQLSADRTQMAGQVANLESAVQHLEDAVAIVSPKGQVLFANPAMRALVPVAAAGASLSDLVPGDHPLRRQADQTLASRQSRGPVSVVFDAAGGESGERLLLTHPVNDANGELVGIMLIVRNLEYLSQVQSTVRYSQKLAALGRLSAGVAHEVKNPLNSMMIHLELLRQKVLARQASAAVLAGASGGSARSGQLVPDGPSDAMQHVDIIATEIRRLDEVVQGFLKFTRPEDLKLQPVVLAALFDEIAPIIKPEADRNRVVLVVDCDSSVVVNGDPAMLRQAFLNVALNACQAMPEGGTLRIQGKPAGRRQVQVLVSDTGSGIRPEHLDKIFDLYFTTKPKGSGIGLSMVYRIVQMHDGEIEIESTPGKGTTFRILLPRPEQPGR